MKNVDDAINHIDDNLRDKFIKAILASAAGLATELLVKRAYDALVKSRR